MKYAEEKDFIFVEEKLLFDCWISAAILSLLTWIYDRLIGLPESY